MVWKQLYPNDPDKYYETLMTAALELYGPALSTPGRYRSLPRCGLAP